MYHYLLYFDGTLAGPFRSKKLASDYEVESRSWYAIWDNDYWVIFLKSDTKIELEDIKMGFEQFVDIPEYKPVSGRIREFIWGCIQSLS